MLILIENIVIEISMIRYITVAGDMDCADGENITWEETRRSSSSVGWDRLKLPKSVASKLFRGLRLEVLGSGWDSDIKFNLWRFVSCVEISICSEIIKLYVNNLMW